MTLPGRFDGRVALVTGASRGIGYAVAERLVAEGGRVVITARRAPELVAAAERLGGDAVAVPVPGHAADAGHQQAAVDAALAAFGALDVLVNNAGINPVAGPVLDAPAEAVAKTFEVNVTAVLGWTRRAIAGGLGRRPGASVVNVASIAGLRPSPPLGVYGASKAALIHLTGELAIELAPRVRVNAVAPAVVRTAFSAMLYMDREQDAAKGYPLGRLGDPEDVAAAVAFLAGDDAAWITGQTVIIDGGLTSQGALA